MMEGLLLIDKPSGWTSFDVVARIRTFVRTATGVKKSKVGHTGTLDPLATGLMIVVVGSYCKRAEEFSKLSKIYEVTMTLGQTSTTGDNEGEKQPVSNFKPSEEDVKSTLAIFKGESMQTPPIYSAIKVNGQRAYKMAREGKNVVLEPRNIKIAEIGLTKYRYPEVQFTADVSSGTYIRSLVEDVGKKLTTGAYMSGLRRVSVGTWNINQAIPMGSFSIETLQQNLVKI